MNENTFPEMLTIAKAAECSGLSEYENLPQYSGTRRSSGDQRRCRFPNLCSILFFPSYHHL